MTVENSEANEFSEESEIAISDEEEAGDGEGGEDLNAFDLDRVDQLEVLYQGTVDWQASHDPPSGVVESSNEFTVGFPEGERDTQDEKTDPEAEEGEGGDDLMAFFFDRRDQLDLLYQGTVDWQASYDAPRAVVESSNEFTVGFPDGERFTEEEEPDGTAETGVGGDDMDAWELDPADTIAALVQGTYEDESDYSIPIGVGQTDANRFTVSDQKSASEPDEQTAGDGIFLGRNVFDLELTGIVYAVADPDEPDLDHALKVGGATITLFPEELEDEDPEEFAGQIIEVETSADGIYTAGLPEFDTRFFLQVEHPVLGQRLSSIEIERADAELDVFYQALAGGSTGLSVGRGVNLG